MGQKNPKQQDIKGGDKEALGYISKKKKLC